MFSIRIRTIGEAFCLLVFTFCLVSCDENKPKSVKTKFSCYSHGNALRADFVSEAYQTFGPTNFYQKVVITKKSNDTSETVLKMDHGYNVRLEWKGDKLLKIIYPEGARIHNYTNFFHSDQSIRIHLSFSESKKGSFTDLNEGCLNN